MFNRLKNKNKAVAIAQLNLNLSNARIARNKALYSQEGIHGTAKTVKKYIRSAFGATSVQFHQIGGLNFRNRAR